MKTEDIEKLFLEKYGNKITASESWVIRFAEECVKLSIQEAFNKCSHPIGFRDSKEGTPFCTLCDKEVSPEVVLRKYLNQLDETNWSKMTLDEKIQLVIKSNYKPNIPISLSSKEQTEVSEMSDEEINTSIETILFSAFDTGRNNTERTFDAWNKANNVVHRLRSLLSPKQKGGKV